MLGMSCLLHSVLSSCINLPDPCLIAQCQWFWDGAVGWCRLQDLHVSWGKYQTWTIEQDEEGAAVHIDMTWGITQCPCQPFFQYHPDGVEKTTSTQPSTYASFPCRHVATVATVPVFTRSFGLEVSTFYTPNFQNSAPRPRNAGIGSSGCPTCDPGIPRWRVRWCGDAAELHEPCEGDCGDPAFRNGPWREA